MTRSQWQTICPYAGSAAIAAASWYGRTPASPMYGITGGETEKPGRGFSTSPASSSRPATCSAMPSDADRPVERMPPAHAYRRSASTRIW